MPTIPVLYVEDEDVNWEVTEFYLRDTYDLTRAKDAKECFSMLKTKTFDLILMDIQLSGSDLNGIEITQVLKGKFAGDPPPYTRGVSLPDIPIIFVTAYSARYNREELIAAGGTDFVTKPVNFTNMSLLVTRLLSRQTMSRLGGGGGRPST